MSSGQSARFGAMLESHSRTLAYRRPTTTKRSLFGLAKVVHGHNPAFKAAESKRTYFKSRPKPYPRNFRMKSEPNRQVKAAMIFARRSLSSRHCGDCPLAPSTRTRPLHRKKKYFSPRDSRLPASSRPTVSNLNHSLSGEASSRPTVSNLNHYSSGEANSRPTVSNLNHYSSGEANSCPTVSNLNHYSSGEANSRPTVSNLNHYRSGEASSCPTVSNLNHYSSGAANSCPTVSNLNHYPSGEANILGGPKFRFSISSANRRI
jgi:hypothetical protein